MWWVTADTKESRHQKSVLFLFYFFFMNNDNKINSPALEFFQEDGDQALQDLFTMIASFWLLDDRQTGKLPGSLCWLVTKNNPHDDDDGEMMMIITCCDYFQWVTLPKAPTKRCWTSSKSVQFKFSGFGNKKKTFSKRLTGISNNK